MRIYIFILIITFPSFCYAQELDTVIDGKHYHAVEYYPTSVFMNGPKTKAGQVLAYGSYEGSCKTTYWIYFNQKGNVLAKGKYRNGKKIGRWHYYSNGEHAVFIWKGSNRISDHITTDGDKTQIVDVVHDAAGCEKNVYINGNLPRFSHTR
ncbi:MAG TPA: hypothetical protein VK177_13220, partial [Flavobacteriales bacterium]|nr:hypothetical protein [Flavobacteriales bacterium]